MTDIQGMRAQLPRQAQSVGIAHQQRRRRRSGVLDHGGRCRGGRLCDRAAHAAFFHGAANRRAAGLPGCGRTARQPAANGQRARAGARSSWRCSRRKSRGATARTGACGASRRTACSGTGVALCRQDSRGGRADVRLRSASIAHRRCAARSAPHHPPARNAQGRREGGSGHKVTAADEKLHCLLTEVPARFCAPNQKRKATADIINYFKGIEYANTAVAAAKIGAVRAPARRGPPC